MDGLSQVWPPTRTSIDGVSLGDVWPCDSLKHEDSKDITDSFVPFHKLSQWLSYSLIEAIEVVYGAKFKGAELLTGLPEYRNGVFHFHFYLRKEKKRKKNLFINCL